MLWLDQDKRSLEKLKHIERQREGTGDGTGDGTKHGTGHDSGGCGRDKEGTVGPWQTAAMRL